MVERMTVERMTVERMTVAIPSSALQQSNFFIVVCIVHAPKLVFAKPEFAELRPCFDAGLAAAVWSFLIAKGSD